MPDDEQGDERAGEPVAEPEIEERPADEPVRPADELRDLDLDAAVVDLEPDRVADDDGDREPEQHGREVDEPRREREHGAQPRDPCRVDLHELGLGQRSPIASASASTSPAMPLAGWTTSVCGQRVAVERVERLAEARVRAKLRERRVAIDER